MKTYILLLRGINVGGHNSVLMINLKKSIEDLEFLEVQTYIQSGNVIFKSDINNSKKVLDILEKQIHEKFFRDIKLILKTKNELEEIVLKNPFVKRKVINLEKLHVTFLSGTPSDENINLVSFAKSSDEFELIRDVIYLHCPKWYGKTKLTNNFFESKLKVNATTRNWNTILTLLSLSEK